MLSYHTNRLVALIFQVSLSRPGHLRQMIALLHLNALLINLR